MSIWAPPPSPSRGTGLAIRVVRLAGVALAMAIIVAASSGTAQAQSRRASMRPENAAPPSARSDSHSTSPLALPKRIYIGNDDHTDYMWSGDDVQYRAAFLNMLDYYMGQAEATASNPSDSRARFNCDGNLWVWEYEHNKSATDFNRLIGHIRAGDISMPLNAAVICYGGMPAEAVLRSMYYAGRLERRFGLRFPLVAAMEDQTLPGGIASLWAGSGALYSWRGVCGCASRTSWGNRPREIYQFQGPDGASVCLRWNTFRNVNQYEGTYYEARNISAAVNYLDGDATFLQHWPWPVSAAFGYGGDDLQTTTTGFVDASISMSNANRRVIVSNEKDFFEDFLAHHASEIPTFSGSFGNEWDLYSASMGEVTAGLKRSIEKLRGAEALATVVSLFDPSFMSSRAAARDQAFMSAGLYYEHDWTADGAISKSRRAQWERDQLAKVSSYVNALYDDALAAIAARVPQSSAERHVVFNPLSWSRTDFADLPSSVAAPLHVIDVAAGVEVPSQVVSVSGASRVRILASDVPSVGYRVYEVRGGAGATFTASATVASPTIDNGIYAVTLGPRGDVTSLIDHRDANHELVDPTGGGGIHELWSGNGTVTVESAGPVSTTLKVVAGGTPAHETRVTLYRGLDRVDVEGTITQNFGNVVSYASRFNLPGAVTRHEEIGMIARVARAAQGGDYADQNARTDYLSFNHFVDLSQATRGVTVSNWDSPFFKAGTSTTSTLDTSTPSIEAVVGMQVDGGTFGIVNQGGDSRFLDRFALRTHGAYDPGAAMRFALEHQNPLIAARATGGANGELSAATWSMISLPSSDVLLWALKPAEEGISQGIIARVWNLAEAPRTMTLSLPSLGIVDARRATHIETDLGPATLVAGVVTQSLARLQIATFRLIPASSPNLADVTPPAAIRDLQ
jgi:alpha-mannosidase